jgi:hypothetical protein
METLWSLTRKQTRLQRKIARYERKLGNDFWYSRKISGSTVRREGIFNDALSPVRVIKHWFVNEDYHEQWPVKIWNAVVHDWAQNIHWQAWCSHQLQHLDLIPSENEHTHILPVTTDGGCFTVATCKQRRVFRTGPGGRGQKKEAVTLTRVPNNCHKLFNFDLDKV